MLHHSLLRRTQKVRLTPHDSHALPAAFLQGCLNIYRCLNVYKRNVDLSPPLEAGFKIVRFTDEEVINNIAGVISKLEIIIVEIEASSPLIPLQRGTKSGEYKPVR